MDEARVPRRARRRWSALSGRRGTGVVAAPPPGLPSAAARWLAHVAPPGVPDAQAVEVWTHGEIRVGRWRSFRARQLIVPGAGFVWAASAGRGPLRVTGFDAFADGAGEMRWRLAGLVPVMSASGPDIDRSAAGRLAAEAVLVPPALMRGAVAWEAVDDARAVARVPAGGAVHAVTLDVGPGGVLREVSLPRWGSPAGGPYRLAAFRVRMDGERRYAGVALPAALEAGWDEDPGGPFMRAAIDRAVLR